MKNLATRLGEHERLRESAEEHLKRHDHAPDSVANEKDTLRLLHELQVHQIELEMQNAELLTLYSRLEKETAQRIEAVEELRRQEKLMIQQNRMAAMGEMISNIAHQWRQPLNVLGMKIQGLPLLHSVGDFSRELLEQHTHEAMELIDHMSRTIDDFQAIHQAVSIVEDCYKHQHIKITTFIRNESTVQGYPNEFSQAILNILQNARDALVERQTVSGLISVVLSVDDGRAVITISDNAGGIPAKVLDKIFEPYFSTKGAQGTGIGLHMSKMIIENHMGGKISARNTSNGAEFKIVV
jgi:signal transduction histidine kinase